MRRMIDTCDAIPKTRPKTRPDGLLGTEKTALRRPQSKSPAKAARTVLGSLTMWP